MNKFSVKRILQENIEKETIEISGWIRNCRTSKNVIFIALNDGSSINNLQIVATPSRIEESVKKNLHAGTCIKIIGKIKRSLGKGQAVEVEADNIHIIGKASPEEYPLQPKKHSMEFLRSIPHLRLRTATFNAVFRIRSTLSFAINKFFYEQDFLSFSTPIITGNDAEGAGEMFTVIGDSDIFKQNKSIEDIDFSSDFFGKKVNLSVSGQLAGETGALAFNKIYTFGPTFRAENSNTSRHLAEFWMVEPEMAFYDLNDDIFLAEKFLKYIIKYTIDNCKQEIAFLDKKYNEIQTQKSKNERDDKGLIEKLEFVINSDFECITYTEAFDILKNCSKNKKKKFKYLVQNWGLDLQSEHERYLTEQYFKKPVVITNFPKGIKAFYMYQNDDDKTVAAMDVLMPGIGEIIGGSQREHRYDKLSSTIESMNIDATHLKWYLDTRKFGTAPHSGFGLGFERLVQFVTGMENIRDVIPFSRTPGKADC